MRYTVAAKVLSVVKLMVGSVEENIRIVKGNVIVNFSCCLSWFTSPSLQVKLKYDCWNNRQNKSVYTDTGYQTKMATLGTYETISQGTYVTIKNVY